MIEDYSKLLPVAQNTKILGHLHSFFSYTCNSLYFFISSRNYFLLVRQCDRQGAIQRQAEPSTGFLHIPRSQELQPRVLNFWQGLLTAQHNVHTIVHQHRLFLGTEPCCYSKCSHTGLGFLPATLNTRFKSLTHPSMFALVIVI